MPYVVTDDRVRLYFEEVGEGIPVVFVHEFGGNYRSWEPQVRYFSRRHRCITYNARGFPPSDVPERPDFYSQERAVRDLLNVIDAVEIEKAHIVGLSMGGFAVLHFGCRFPERAHSLVVGGCGYGAEKDKEAYFRQVSEDVARGFETLGSKRFGEIYALGASRVQFQNKDPRGWREFADQLCEQSALGSANTMRGVQAKRPSLYDMKAELEKMAIPTLIISGDEDDHCLQPAIFLKQTLPACGLLVLPKTGHTINLEEPDAFNRALAEIFALAEAGRWLRRDPRARPDQVMRTG